MDRIVINDGRENLWSGIGYTNKIYGGAYFGPL